jgi:hypothetical protein
VLFANNVFCGVPFLSVPKRDVFEEGLAGENGVKLADGGVGLDGCEVDCLLGFQNSSKLVPILLPKNRATRLCD